MSAVSGPTPNGHRISIDPPGRLAEGKAVDPPGRLAEGKPAEPAKTGQDAIKARIGRDAPGGFGPPPSRSHTSAQNTLGPRLAKQSVVTDLGAVPTEIGGQRASKPRVTFNTDANTVRHFEIEAGAHLHPVPSKALARAARAPAASTGHAAVAQPGTSGQPVDSGGTQRLPKVHKGDWEFETPKTSNFLSRLFSPRKADTDRT